MKHITNTEELKNEILQLQYRRTDEWQLLKQQFHDTYEHLKPINLIKNTIKEATSSPNFKDDILDTGIGITAGYLSKKIFVGAIRSPLIKLLGILLQFGVSNMVTKNSGTLKSIGTSILKKVFSKKETEAEKFHGNSA